MAENHSFDITTGCDLQEVDNAVNQANKALAQRYDFRGVDYTLRFERSNDLLLLQAPSAFLLEAIWEMLVSKLARRQVPIANLKRGECNKASLGTVKQEVSIVQSIDAEQAKAIVKALKGQQFKKLQAAIQADQIRVTCPSLDELQACMQWLSKQDFTLQLQFGNYR